MAVINNKLKSCVVHAAGANATITVAGNNTVSNITSSASQILTGASITRVWYGASTGHWNIKRGANLVSTFVGSGYAYFDGAALTVDKTATLVLELIGTANGYIMVELHKEGNLE